MSPILFNFVVDSLSTHIHWLVDHLIPGGVSHLQYADDRLLLFQKTDLDIISVKFLLYSFEGMSGMKMNYHNSEVFVLGHDI